MNETLEHLKVSDIMNIAIQAAKKAGNYLNQKLGHAKVSYQKARRDDLLDADLEAERIILSILENATPTLGILSEEAGRKGSEEHYWVIDPLDGSANFQHGSPLFGVAIALVINNDPVGSVIYLPVSNELFTAIKSQGAYLNGSPIHVSTTSQLEEAIAHIGDFSKNGESQETARGLQEFSQLAPLVRRVRMLGTAATDLAYLAMGRADILINHVTAPWDALPGTLLLQEAGGKMSAIDHETHKPLSIYTNSLLQKPIEELLKG